MAVNIVDCLESVEVEQHHGEVQFLATRPKNRDFEAVGKQGAVGQSGQRVVQCEAAGVIQFLGESPRTPLEHKVGVDELTAPILSSAQGCMGRVKTRQQFRDFRERWSHAGHARGLRGNFGRRFWRIAACLRHARGRIILKGMGHRLEATRFVFCSPKAYWPNPPPKSCSCRAASSLIMRLASSSP